MKSLAQWALAAVLAAGVADVAVAKDKGNKGNGKGPAKSMGGHPGKGHGAAKVKVKQGGPQLVKKSFNAIDNNPGRGASSFAPGRSGNLPPGHGGVPPGQLKKAVNNEVALQRYLSVPTNNYGLTYANGYAGQGYYWGPRDVPYFYEGPSVRYFDSRNLVPREYWSSGYGLDDGMGAEVQQELARLGYYHGPIDGSIGPGSREAIRRFQADQGLPVTGRVDGPLLQALRFY